ncbi:nucleolar zinc-finger protein [Malassezia vespertilionis]|uniref:Zpr1p n=1 Tax=Malassezia vespertilionis TaxID=2020962 RepID=A0A2N1JG66_9BASI|nr:nucleolar zinc-finger protein [Malassezia vespertilionis]PKI85542.1 Zpr1p [Malassezia vespertilionis]WFD04778.1 nucleolar zinc-finger protein [Malassezia vespertilionis]
MSQQGSSEQFFQPIGDHAEAAEDIQPIQEIESLCMRCGEQGITRLLPTYIPYFKEVIVMSFSCSHCGERNSEIQSAGEIQPKGSLYTIHIVSKSDLNRQVVKSEFCTTSIPEVQLQIPARRGQITTVEGIVSDTLRDLEIDQPLRKHMDPDTHAKIEEVCDKLRVIMGERRIDEEDTVLNENEPELKKMRSVGPVSAHHEEADSNEERSFSPFRLVLDDPSGNSFVEYRGSIESSGAQDNRWSKRDYPRSKEQNNLLGLVSDPEAPNKPATAIGGGGVEKELKDEEELMNEEVYNFEGNCSSCNAPSTTKMKKVNIPYFKDIFIMSTNCDNCGFRDNEVKSGSAISEHGRRLTLKVEDKEDLSRDILKSETAGLSVPELDLYLSPGTLGGRFTTLEGLLENVYDELYEKVFMRGDSVDADATNRFERFLGALKRAINGESFPYTLILDDPLANSYIQNPYAPDPDEQVTVENYDRTFDQNEDLGLNDMKVENYGEDGTEELAQVA